MAVRTLCEMKVDVAVTLLFFPMFLAFAGCIVLSCSIATAQDAASSPKPTPSPGGVPTNALLTSDVKFSGTLRAYDFVRQNSVQNATNPNRSAFTIGGAINADYNVGATGFHFGATYVGYNGLGANGDDPQFNPQIDNSLPGFPLSTFEETYLRYTSKRFSTTVGNQIINERWAPISDARVKPNAFQGLTASYEIVPHLTLGVSRILAYEGRTASDFERTTLLTSSTAGFPANPKHFTNGFLQAKLQYATPSLSALVDNYSYYDIASLSYAEFRNQFSAPFRPFVALQYVNENQTGRAVIGRIHNNTYGFQIGASATKNLQVALSLDDAPIHAQTVAATNASAATAGIFAPITVPGTVSALGSGRFNVAGGGIASPFTGTDVLFTKSIADGLVVRRSAGNSYKATLTYASDNKRLIGLISRAFYAFGTKNSPYSTHETDIDITYYFNTVKKGPYRGLSIRERYADRSQPNLPFEFTYVRTQLQYQF